jgi:hypothetical protein
MQAGRSLDTHRAGALDCSQQQQKVEQTID